MTRIAEAREPLLPRLSNFFRKPSRQKFQSFAFRWLRWLPGIPLPVRLSSGGWWLAENDFLGGSILWEGYENAEYAFASRCVQPGMTVLDIGAHKGFYTLLFSRRVGPSGRVVAFEPSPRERRKLKRHIRLNFCRNVHVEDCALGESEETATLYVVDGSETGCNSLRPPQTESPTFSVPVRVRGLDDVLADLEIDRVDFVKLDVEGGELGVLKGATRLLNHPFRPVILAEVLDLRTRPWGYAACEIVQLLARLGYEWLQLLPDGRPARIEAERETYDSNLIAIPGESLVEVLGLK